ncbi:MAG: extracellular solute-binding protein [Chloroflexi bacterium]|nr:extracellular solute-binding protein [Chloroflexota bacterium]
MTILFLTACAISPTPLAPTATPRARTDAPAERLSPTPAPNEIQLWFSATPDQFVTMYALVEKFNATQTRVRVRANNIGAYSDLLKRVSLAQTFNLPPDLFLLNPSDIAAQIKSGAIIPLDDLMQDPDIGLRTTDGAGIFNAFIDRYPQFNNRVYSLAPARQMQVMFYNADLLKSIGFSKPPETWDEFTRVCAAISKPPDIFCYALDLNAYDFAASVYARGGELISADAKTVAFNSKPALDALTQIKDHLTKGYTVPTKIAFQAPLDFANRKIAFAFDSLAGLRAYEQSIKSADKPFNWSVATFPRASANPNRVALVYGQAFAIYKSTRERERAAFAFIKWMMDAAPSAEFAKAFGAFPARETSRNLLSDYFSAHPAYASAFDALKFARTEPNVAGWSNIRVVIADSLAAVVSGKMSPPDALQDAEKKANAVLDK